MAAGLPWLDDPIGLSSSSLQTQAQRNGRNVFDLLAQREISPRTKYLARRKWGETSKLDVESYFEPKIDRVRDARRELLSWVEAESLRHLTAKYCPLVPSPRSTIAAAFSPDGKTLASTHGDHTVKLIDYETGRCLRVLSGHRRTPWVVRFHPVHLEILASGSLDNEVRLWNTNTSECIGSRDFYRPIASIAFHAEGELLAIASGHKLYLWNYNINGEHSSPTVVLRTNRSLRAVNFHQHAAPLLLTAEVNDLDSADSSVARATSLGALHYPPPSVFLANVGPSDSLSLAAELPLMYSPLSYVPVEFRQNEVLSSINPTSWELPFLQGWLMGQRQAGIPSTLPPSGGQQDYSNSGGGGIPVPMINRIQSDLAASMAATEAAELPCTVKLRIWSHNLKSPCAPFNAERCLLTVPHAVLCSEMGAHFSPCGRFLAACVACVLPESEADPGLLNQFHQDVTGAATSPTRHPIAARQVMYELRIYSLEEPTFGSVLISRAIRAAHCLTSIQFSPTSEHILLAYGRRHSSLLKSIVVTGETSLPIYTVLEVYRVSNMELLSILPSAEDEVNVACFHPSAGGGLAYGTKEGKLRFLQYDGAHDLDNTSPNILSQEDMVQPGTVNRAHYQLMQLVGTGLVSYLFGFYPLKL